MTEARVTAAPYRIGSSVSSVELLLEARTAADGAAPLAMRQLGAATRLDGPLEVTRVVPGPAAWEGAHRFVLEARSGALGSLLVQPATVLVIADLVMGGRGIPEDRPPAELELDLFTQRLLLPLGTIVDAVAPGRPAPVALVERELDAPARSLVVELSLAHQGAALDMQLEILAHHVADDAAVDSSTMEATCGEVPLELTFRFAPVSLRAGEVAALALGDVICLEHEAGTPVVGEVDGTPLVRGRVGRSRRHAAVEVIELIERSH